MLSDVGADPLPVEVRPQMRQKRHVSYYEIDGYKQGISRSEKRKLLLERMADELPDGSVVESRRIRRASSTRYVDDPTWAGRWFKYEQLSLIRRSRQNKPEIAEGYQPLPFGFGMENAA